MNKFILLLLILSTPLFASQKSLNEENVLTHLHFLYRSVKINGAMAQVKGPKLSKRVELDEITSERFSFKKRKFLMPTEELNFERSLAHNTYTAVGNSGDTVGTAFYVGGEFILTNFHVWNHDYVMNTCDHFKVKTNPDHGSKSFKCKKVHHCKKELDFCLVEIKPNGKVPLSRLTVLPRLKLEIEENQIVRLIGNVGGNGLQASKGRGLIHTGTRYLHQAPLFKGASGGPLFNEGGEVIAINFAESEVLKGPKAKNYAIPLKYIKEELERNLEQSILDQLAL
jgi:hypothetical protein